MPSEPLVTDQWYTVALWHKSATVLLPRVFVPLGEAEGMPKRYPPTPAFTRVNARIPTKLVLEIDEARTRLRRDGVGVSYASFVEVAVKELLARGDLAAILRKHGAKARRD